MKFTALAVVVLALGIVIGFALQGTVFEAEAAKPPPTGRVIELGTLSTTIANPRAQFPLVDTSDCSEMSAFATSSVAAGIEFKDIFVSVDGSTIFRADFLTGPTPSLGALGSTALLGAWPFVQLGAQNAGSDTDITAWIWCAP